jgi:hypothetical protein
LIEVFDGRGLDQVKCRRGCRVGAHVSGVIRSVPRVGPVLEEVQEVIPPDQAAAEGEESDQSPPSEME